MPFNIIELLILLHVYEWFYNKIIIKQYNLNVYGATANTKIHIQTRGYYTMSLFPIHMQAGDLLVSCVIGGNKVVKSFLSHIQKANH